MSNKPTRWEIVKWGFLAAAFASLLNSMMDAWGGTPEDQLFAVGLVVTFGVFVGLFWVLFYPLWPWTKRFIVATGGYVDEPAEVREP